VKAVQKEAASIRKRKAQNVNDLWQDPNHYTLLTNVAPSAEVRQIIESTILEVLPNAMVHTLGGNDISDILDNHPPLRRAFPQLLSLRDLDELLSGVVNRDVLVRSEGALACAKEVAPTFGPTNAYHRAFEVLNLHHFVVLEGPPEMGKTAIAWTIALTQLCQGWEAIVCDEPEDLFRLQ